MCAVGTGIRLPYAYSISCPSTTFYKVPKLIFIRDELPMLPIGKLDRQALRKQSLQQA